LAGGVSGGGVVVAAGVAPAALLAVPKGMTFSSFRFRLAATSSFVVVSGFN
jgi:hypothetical protein